MSKVALYKDGACKIQDNEDTIKALKLEGWEEGKLPEGMKSAKSSATVELEKQLAASKADVDRLEGVIKAGKAANDDLVKKVKDLEKQLGAVNKELAEATKAATKGDKPGKADAK